MQSDRKIFCRDVILDSYNKESRDEDNILVQINRKQICPEMYYEEFHLKKYNYVKCIV